MPIPASQSKHHEDLFRSELAALLPDSRLLTQLSWRVRDSAPLAYHITLAVGPTTWLERAYAYVTLHREGYKMGFIAENSTVAGYDTERYSFDEIVVFTAQRFNEFIRTQVLPLRLKSWLLPLGVSCAVSSFAPPNDTRRYWAKKPFPLSGAGNQAMREHFDTWSLGLPNSPALYGLATNWAVTLINQRTPYAALQPLALRPAFAVGLAPLQGDLAWMALIAGTGLHECSAFTFRTDCLGYAILGGRVKRLRQDVLMAKGSLAEALEVVAEAEGAQLRHWYSDHYQQHYPQLEQRRLEHERQVVQAQAWLLQER